MITETIKNKYILRKRVEEAIKKFRHNMAWKHSTLDDDFKELKKVLDIKEENLEALASKELKL